MLAPMLAADEAERRGDARGALAIIAEHPADGRGASFWRPWRVERLVQLEAFAPVLPRWVTSRWILAQAAQFLHPSLSLAHHRALRTAVDLRGGERHLPGADREDAMCAVMDHDWVYRQLVLFEYGALSTFLSQGATPDLLAGADRIDEWAAAPMRGLRYLGRTPATLTWLDLANDERIEVPNLGAAVMEVPGEHVLGRLVPTEDGAMFECAPLCVPEATARAAAAAPDAWLAAVEDGVREARARDADDVIATGFVRGCFLLTDVPAVVSQLALASCLDDRALRRPGFDDLVSAVLRLARSLGTGRLQVEPDRLDPWPCLAAELLKPGVLPRLEDLLGPGDAELFGVLAERLAGPAAAVCGELAMLDRAA